MRRTAQLLAIIHVTKATNIEYNRGDCEIFSRQWSCASGVPVGQSPPENGGKGGAAKMVRGAANKLKSDIMGPAYSAAAVGEHA